MGLLKQAIVVLIVAYLISNLPRYFEEKLPPVSGGYVHPDFRKVEEVFRKNIESGAEKGGSFAVFYKGEPLVDLWGGYADLHSGRPWSKDTQSILFSSTKGVEALLVAKFVDQGLLDYKKLVSHYWPKFAHNGKDNITLELLVSHQGGLSITDDKIPLNWMLDEPEKVDEFIERQKTYWPPGTGIAYHAITIGLYLDRLLSRVDPKKRPASQIFRDEIAIPFDIDMYNGMPLSETYRTTTYYHASLSQSLWETVTYFNMQRLSLLLIPLQSDSILMRAANSAFKINDHPYYLNNPETKQYPGGAFNGHGNARSLAKLYGIVANGGEHKGKKLMSKKMVDLLNTPLQGPGTKNSLDGIFGDEGIRAGLGVFFFPYGKSPKIFGTSGYGGQLGYADVQNQLGVGYVTNHFTSFSLGDSPNLMAYQEAFYECFEKFKKKQK